MLGVFFHPLYERIEQIWQDHVFTFYEPQLYDVTLPETNIAPEKGLFQ